MQIYIVARSKVIVVVTSVNTNMQLVTWLPCYAAHNRLFTIVHCVWPWHLSTNSCVQIPSAALGGDASWKNSCSQQGAGAHPPASTKGNPNHSRTSPISLRFSTGRMLQCGVLWIVAGWKISTYAQKCSCFATHQIWGI